MLPKLIKKILMNCFKCKYKESIPRNAHISCKLDWSKVKEHPPVWDRSGAVWYNFPFNFDPVWQKGQCYFADKPFDESLKIKNDIFFSLISILCR